MSAGCSTDPVDGGAEPNKKPAVRMDGTMWSDITTRAEFVPGAIDPEDGLPSRQLDVAIVNVNHNTADPATDQPGVAGWSSQTVELSRGFFASRDDDSDGILAPGATPDNGLIEYVDPTGMYVTTKFYPEIANEHYFLRVVYPYRSDYNMLEQSDMGAVAVFRDLTGQEDILCSDLGWGSQDQPTVETGAQNPGMVMSHKFAQLRFWVVADNMPARAQFGWIEEVIAREQPNMVQVDMLDGMASVHPDAVSVDYNSDMAAPIELSTTLYDPLLPDQPQGQYAGSLMVLPATKYRIGALTSERNWIGADYIFANPIEPGKIYDVTLRFMESYRLELAVTEADEWWMDSIFD
jgi:hypothetical protein